MAQAVRPSLARVPHRRVYLARSAAVAALLLGLCAPGLPALAQSNPLSPSQPDTLRLSADSSRVRGTRNAPTPPPPPNLDAFRRTLQNESGSRQLENRQREQEYRRQLSIARQFEFVGQHERALDLYRSLHEERRTDRQAFQGVQRNLMALQRFEAAEALLRRELREMQVFTSKSDILAELGAVLYEAGQPEQAMATWEQALETPPLNDRRYQEVASAQLRLRLIDDAIRTYQRGREDLNDPIAFAIHLAGLHTARMDWTAAAGEYINVLRLNQHRTHYVTRGLANFPDDPAANDAVVAAIEAELARDPATDPWDDYRLHLHELLIDQRKKNADYATALPHVARLDDLEGSGGRRLMHFAVESLEEGFEDVARATLDSAAVRMQSPEGRDMIALLRGSLHEARDEMDAAAEQYSLIAADPSTDDVERAARMSRGLLRLRHLDQPAEAVDDFRRVRELGWPADDRELDYVEAVALIQLDSLDAALIPLRRPVQGEPRQRGVFTPINPNGEDDRRIKDADLNHLAARVLLWSGDREVATALMDSLLSPTTGVASENETLLLLHLQTTTQDSAALEIYAQADRAEFQGQADQALSLYDSLATRGEDDDLLTVEAAYAAALLRLHRDGDTNAVTAFADRFSGQPRVEEAWYELGQWWLDQGNPEEAAVAFEMVLMEAPEGLLHGLARLRLEELTTPLFLPDEES